MTFIRSSTLVVLLGSCVSPVSADEPKLERILPPSGLANSMALSADGKLLATGSGGKMAMLWDVVGGKQVRTFSGHSGYVGIVALSGDGKLLLTGSDRTATLWEAATGKKRQTFQEPTQDIAGVALSADGKLVVTSAAN